jgi:hypothetical protein
LILLRMVTEFDLLTIIHFEKMIRNKLICSTLIFSR